MSRVRIPAVAGSFYPANPTSLASAVDAMLGDDAPIDVPPPKALIVPHAGYVYSGPVAASAYRLLRPARTRIRRVVLVGPAHFVPVEGIATTAADAFATPLGDVVVDDELRRAILGLPRVLVDDQAHASEHSIEVELPFLQRVLDAFTLLPIVVGDARPPEVANVLERVYGGPETLLVISSDLSHYLDYETATACDRGTADVIVARRFEEIAPGHACGAAALCGVLELARRRDLAVRLLDLRNSGDTAGSRDEVVGYGAFALGS